MEVEAKKGKSKAKSAPKSSKSKVKPNPDEVVDIERPSSAVSSHKSAELFTAPGDTQNEPAAESEPHFSGTKTTTSRPSTAKSGQIVPMNGSEVSLRSGKSKEAWQGEELKPDTPTNIFPPKKQVTGTTAPSSREETGTSSVAQFQPGSRVKNEEQAYVPYLFARETIVRIVNDMHQMKENHITVIDQIEMNYKMIEDETQRQFNSFVLNLRNVYKDKLAVFQHVIDIHRRDTDKKTVYWDSSLASLSSQNKKLLKDKKALLIQNKLLFDRLAVVKEEERRALIGQIDELQLKLNQETSGHKDVIEQKAHLENQVRELEAEIEELKNRPTVTQVLTDTSETKPVAATEEATVTVVPLVVPIKEEDELKSKKVATPLAHGEPEVREVIKEVVKEVYIDASEAEKAELAKERQRVNQELAELSKRRENLDKEREILISDKKTLNEEKNDLTLKLNGTEKVIAEWKGKYDVTREQLDQFTSLRTDYDTLLAAFNAMAAAASDMNQAEQKLQKNKEDKASLEEDKVQFEKDIETWKADFKARNKGKEPQEEDFPDSIKEFNVMLHETEAAIQRLDAETVTIENLKKGEAPPPPKMSAKGDKASSVAEPIIRTIEVKVADPKVVADLQAAEEKNDKLQKELADQQQKHDEIHKEMSEMRDKISDLESECKSTEAENVSNKKKISELKEKLKEQKTTAVVAGESSGGPIDHTECERRIEDLEEQIQALQEQIDEAATGHATSSATIDIQASTDKSDELQSQLDEMEENLRQERSAHSDTKDELEKMKSQCQDLQGQLDSQNKAQEEMIANATSALKDQAAKNEKEVAASRARVSELEAQLVANVPVDVGAEMKKLLKKITSLTKEKDAQSKSISELEAKVKQTDTDTAALQKQLEKEKQGKTQLEEKLKSAKAEKDAEIDKLVAQWDKKEKARVAENKEKITALNKKIKELESRPAAAAAAPPGKAAPGGDAKSQKQLAALTEQLQEKKKENKDLQAKITQLQDDVKKAKSEGTGDIKEQKKQEKVLKEMSKKLDLEMKKAERDGAKVKELEAELTTVTKDRDSKDNELKKLKVEVEQLGLKQGEVLELTEKVKTMEDELKHLNKETQRLTEAYQSERVQRKKYFNMVEDMKGKIRVYCRARPMSGNELERGNFSVLKSQDEYSIAVESSRGVKEFTFDRVFMPENTQDQVFEDTYHLVQSAVDGYNVCIFAYGQTGSGKTFTMIGDRDQKFPGIAPRAFKRIFDLVDENKDKFTFNITTYMMELYNDKLLDLYGGKEGTPDDKMDIKKDTAGLVFVKGAVVKQANSEAELQKLFDEGSKNRHVASTKMNAESSRSHLILSVIIEATNKLNGQVNRGKLSLVDLAGSERVSKTGASAETLKEANSINKSLAALGDVISALSSDAQFIPYRNNKLTMLMQDSLGGNAKTLMFVNISPADYNSDETVTSLTYASRVKLITNDAQKSQDSKEVARLKAVIAKLQAGETPAEEEI